ncbi:hypothetical protein T8T21_16840 (plasmid) [Limimaricola variabilis]|uniref:hypothetical protein n=1 Tax=Limimaricola variabilis TaxID=1492771 RepID=UPI002AC8F136|nr:hypothetical protein [Limimaricola variabilis]WPY96177.1 hypothetical protein T8T21_16840 [Limimaricola variabilis]
MVPARDTLTRTGANRYSVVLVVVTGVSSLASGVLVRSISLVEQAEKIVPLSLKRELWLKMGDAA